MGLNFFFLLKCSRCCLHSEFVCMGYMMPMVKKRGNSKWHSEKHPTHESRRVTWGNNDERKMKAHRMTELIVFSNKNGILSVYPSCVCHCHHHSLTICVVSLKLWKMCTDQFILVAKFALFVLEKDTDREMLISHSNSIPVFLSTMWQMNWEGNEKWQALLMMTWATLVKWIGMSFQCTHTERREKDICIWNTKESILCVSLSVCLWRNKIWSSVCACRFLFPSLSHALYRKREKDINADFTVTLRDSHYSFVRL